MSARAEFVIIVKKTTQMVGVILFRGREVLFPNYKSVHLIEGGGSIFFENPSLIDIFFIFRWILEK